MSDDYEKAKAMESLEAARLQRALAWLPEEARVAYHEVDDRHRRFLHSVQQIMGAIDPRDVNEAAEFVEQNARRVAFERQYWTDLLSRMKERDVRPIVMAAMRRKDAE